MCNNESMLMIFLHIIGLPAPRHCSPRHLVLAPSLPRALPALPFPRPPPSHWPTADRHPFCPSAFPPSLPKNTSQRNACYRRPSDSCCPPFAPALSSGKAFKRGGREREGLHMGVQSPSFSYTYVVPFHFILHYSNGSTASSASCVANR